MSQRCTVGELKRKDLQEEQEAVALSEQSTMRLWLATYVPKKKSAVALSATALLCFLEKLRRGTNKIYFTSQVSPARRSLPRSPGPRLAMTAWTCWFITSS